MVRADEDALICDFAETYHIYDYKRLPLSTAAALAVGLRDTSRIKMKLSGAVVANDIQLMAAAVDRLGLLVWAQTKDAEKGINRPPSILDAFNHRETDTTAYESGEDFMAEREKLLKGGLDGN